jgi:hypothetical protein
MRSSGLAATVMNQKLETKGTEKLKVPESNSLACECSKRKKSTPIWTELWKSNCATRSVRFGRIVWYCMCGGLNDAN